MSNSMVFDVEVTFPAARCRSPTSIGVTLVIILPWTRIAGGVTPLGVCSQYVPLNIERLQKIQSIAEYSGVHGARHMESIVDFTQSPLHRIKLSVPKPSITNPGQLAKELSMSR